MNKVPLKYYRDFRKNSEKEARYDFNIVMLVYLPIILIGLVTLTMTLTFVPPAVWDSIDNVHPMVSTLVSGLAIILFVKYKFNDRKTHNAKKANQVLVKEDQDRNRQREDR